MTLLKISNLIQPRSKETNECEWVEFLAYQCQCLWGHHPSLTLPFVTCRVWSQFDIFLSISVFSWGGRLRCEKQYFFYILSDGENQEIWWIAPEEMLLYGCLLKVHDRPDLMPSLRHQVQMMRCCTHSDFSSGGPKTEAGRNWDRSMRNDLMRGRAQIFSFILFYHLHNWQEI